MDGLEQYRAGRCRAAPEIELEFRDLAFDFAQRVHHRSGVGRACNAGIMIAPGRLDRESDQLPRRGKLAQHQNQRIGQQFVRHAERGFEQGHHAIDQRRGEIWDMAGQPALDQGKRVAASDDREQIADILERRDRTDLAGEPAAGLFVRCDRGERDTNPLDQALVEKVSEMVARRGVGGGERAAGLLLEARGLLRHQIATDPAPDRNE